MAAAKWNKRRHFEQEVLPELDVLFAAALYLACDQDGANDLCEKTIVRAYRAFNSRLKVSNYRAWLLTILHEIVRSEKPAAPSSADTVLGPSRSGEPLSRIGAVLNRECSTTGESSVDRALHELPDDFRAAVVMVDVAELTYHDAAEVLEVPIETVRARISQGRALMRSALAQLRGPEGFARA
jgi:RNA polymerase sigma-70 factor, ECF subfamily